MAIRLVEVDKDNWEDVVDLEVYEEQEDFVADNAYSLAESKYRPECVPLAVCNDGEVVGFMMYHTPYPEDDDYWFFRFMIDRNHQNNGYGRDAMRLVLDIIQQDKEYNRVYLSFAPENIVAKALYESMGFVPDGRVIDDELVYVLNY